MKIQLRNSIKDIIKNNNLNTQTFVTWYREITAYDQIFNTQDEKYLEESIYRFMKPEVYKKLHTNFYKFDDLYSRQDKVIYLDKMLKHHYFIDKLGTKNDFDYLMYIITIEPLEKFFNNYDDFKEYLIRYEDEILDKISQLKTLDINQVLPFKISDIGSKYSVEYISQWFSIAFNALYYLQAQLDKKSFIEIDRFKDIYMDPKPYEHLEAYKFSKSICDFFEKNLLKEFEYTWDYSENLGGEAQLRPVNFGSIIELMEVLSQYNSANDNRSLNLYSASLRVDKYFWNKQEKYVLSYLEKAAKELAK